MSLSATPSQRERSDFSFPKAGEISGRLIHQTTHLLPTDCRSACCWGSGLKGVRKGREWWRRSGDRRQLTVGAPRVRTRIFTGGCEQMYAHGRSVHPLEITPRCFGFFYPRSFLCFWLLCLRGELTLYLKRNNRREKFKCCQNTTETFGWTLLLMPESDEY